ncbi:hypothetical protein [Vallitalea guaymasensis]|uniref:hypothetical protein n=1 Tax=Vallitalea guaymasensis TaxID=1185412 RepID=UPI0023572569|nr:hypothetical protein [Vallitalea guaymasensis]
MRIIFYEAKKLLIYQKGLFFIGLFFLINIAYLVIADKPYNTEMELFKNEYTYYMDKIDGKCTPKKIDFIENEAEKIMNANISSDKLYNDYYDGSITENVFNKQCVNFETILENEKGFDEIYNQYIYVRENENNRFFLYTNGWNALLTDDNLDLFLTILILILVTPVFCYEYDNKMDTLVLTSIKGKKNYSVHKIIFVFCIVAFLCITTFILKFIFYNQKYSLLNGNYPLQSLSYFGTGRKSISLIQTFFAISGLKLFGFLFFAILIMFISVIVKKYSLTVFICAAFILIPYFGFDLGLIYSFPLPLSFMLGVRFFKGYEYQIDFFTQEKVAIFKEISNMTLLIFLVSAICLCIIMLKVINKNNKNIWNKIHIKKIKRVTVILISCILILNLSGCSKTNINESCVFNTNTRRSYESEKYRYYVDESDLENIRLVFEDKATGEKNDLVRNPIKELIKEEMMIFGKDSFVYYIKYNIDKSKNPHLGGVTSKVTVVELDTKTFNEKIIFEKNNFFIRNDSFIGLGDSQNKQWQFLKGVSAFFLDREYLYFVMSNTVKRVNRKTEKISSIDIPTNKNIAYDGRFIYYIGDKLILSKYDTVTETHVKMSDIVTTYFLLTDTKILFINRLDNSNIYSADLHGNIIGEISSEPALWFSCDEDYITYKNKIDLKEYHVKY